MTRMTDEQRQVAVKHVRETMKRVFVRDGEPRDLLSPNERVLLQRLIGDMRKKSKEVIAVLAAFWLLRFQSTAAALVLAMELSQESIEPRRLVSKEWESIAVRLGDELNRRTSEAKERARSAAGKRHAPHARNKKVARDWYATHRHMTKDAAAEKMAKDRVVPASFRTIRGYLTGL